MRHHIDISSSSSSLCSNSFLSRCLHYRPINANHLARRSCLRPFIVSQGSSPEQPGEETPETLFMRELKRRGLSKTSEDAKSQAAPETSPRVDVEEEVSGFNTQNRVKDPFDDRQANQRERSMALNSEGLEGLIPRAQALLSLGGSFFLAFGPLILSSITIFAVLYFYYGPTFIHNGPAYQQKQQTYVDPYELLEKEQIPSDIGEFVPFN